MINITTLAQLNAIRYDLNGDGRADAPSDASAYETAFGLLRDDVACVSGCEGYELMNALDFRLGATLTDDYSIWAEGSTATGAVAAGWEPIGTTSDPYRGVFEGNGNTISNLFIDRSSTNNVGLFGYVDGAALRNLGIEDGSVTGQDNTGALAGTAFSTTITLLLCHGKRKWFIPRRWSCSECY